VGDGKLGFNLSGNYVKNARDGAVNNPAIVAAGQSVVNDTQEVILSSRPEMKFILGLTMTLVNLDSILNTYFVKRNLLNKVYKI
jgi:hypothetical protein